MNKKTLIAQSVMWAAAMLIVEGVEDEKVQQSVNACHTRYDVAG